MSRPRSLLRFRELLWFRRLVSLEGKLATARKAAEAAEDEHGAASASAEYARLQFGWAEGRVERLRARRPV